MRELRRQKNKERKKTERNRVTTVKRNGGLDTNIDRGINKIEISQFID